MKLFLFVYVQLLDVENHFLLEASLVVLGDGYFGEAVLDAHAYACHALFFVRLNAGEQLAYCLYALGKEFFK